MKDLETLALAGMGLVGMYLVSKAHQQQTNGGGGLNIIQLPTSIPKDTGVGLASLTKAKDKITQATKNINTRGFDVNLNIGSNVNSKINEATKNISENISKITNDMKDTTKNLKDIAKKTNETVDKTKDIIGKSINLAEAWASFGGLLSPSVKQKIAQSKVPLYSEAYNLGVKTREAIENFKEKLKGIFNIKIPTLKVPMLVV